MIACSLFIYIGINNMPPINEKDSNEAAIHITKQTDKHISSEIISEANDSSLLINPDSLTKEDSEALTHDNIFVRNTYISLGDKLDYIIDKLGVPSRIDETEHDFVYYIYNNDYKRLLYVAISNDRVVGYYTDSIDLNYMNITPASDINAINNSLGTRYTLESVLTYKTDNHTTKILMDTLGTGKITGIYTMSNSVKLLNYPDSSIYGIELMVYDLINSTRVRNNSSLLSWSSSAAKAARKHSRDMADNNFFSHVGPGRQNPYDRLNNEGIYCRTIGENIIAGYGGAILSNHAWFNSKEHRNNMLDNSFSCVGVGFVYASDSIYGTYITQDFYR